MSSSKSPGSAAILAQTRQGFWPRQGLVAAGLVLDSVWRKDELCAASHFRDLAPPRPYAALDRSALAIPVSFERAQLDVVYRRILAFVGNSRRMRRAVAHALYRSVALLLPLMARPTAWGTRGQPMRLAIRAGRAGRDRLAWLWWWRPGVRLYACRTCPDWRDALGPPCFLPAQGRSRSPRCRRAAGGGSGPCAKRVSA